MRFSRPLLIATVTALLSGCSSVTETFTDTFQDRELEYKHSREESPLEIPPDLSTANISSSMVIPAESAVDTDGSATYSQYNSQRGQGVTRASGVLPSQDDIEVKRDGDKRWLVINGTPDEVWPKVRDFWSENGWLLTLEEPSTGIMETDWAENRADIPDGLIRGLLGSVLDSVYSSATRDKYRVRLENGLRPGTTELFLTHRGVEETAIEGGSTERFMWVPRPADPELEAAMLRRLMMYMGVEEEVASNRIANVQPRRNRAKLVEGPQGATAVVVDAPLNQAWRLTGLALDRVGFTVEDRDRRGGVYFVRYDDPLEGQEKKGFLSKLAFWSDDEKPKEVEYRVKLEGKGKISRIQVLNKDGQVETSPTGSRILTLLYEQLK